MRERDAQLAGGNGRGHRRIHVAVTHHAVGLLRAENGSQFQNGLCRKVHGVGVGNLQVIIRRRQVKTFEKGLRHFVVVVLARVDEHFLDFPASQLLVHQIFFDKIRSGSYN